MIKRSANKQGLVTFNISFQNLKPNSNLSKLDTGNAPSPFNELTQASFLSNRSNPLTPLDFDGQPGVLRHESRSISSDIDCFDGEDTQPPEYPSTKLFHHSHGNDENISRALTEESPPQEPIDFEELQRFTGTRIDRDDEDKSSASTLSKSSKKIAKAKAGFVYKESRFKEEARIKGKRQAWQPHEDEQVLELVAKHGQSWALIASMMEGRSGKQIRDRYLNKLRPDINNEEWTKEEDNLLISLFRTIGRKWSKIATNMPGRTEGQVKNRFYSHIQKRVLKKESLDYASASPEGEMSPASKVNEIISRKPISERKFFGESFHNGAGYQVNKDKLRVQVSRNNAALNVNKSLGFEEMKIYNNNLQRPKTGFESGVEDPTAVISYNEISNSNIKRMSPEKYQNRNAFSYGEVKETGLPQNNQNFFGREARSDCLLGPEQDSTGFTELAQEFKARCNTGNFAKENVCQNGEFNYIERSPLQFKDQSIDQFLNKEVYADNKVGYNSMQTVNANTLGRGNAYDYRNMMTQGMHSLNSLNSYRYPNQNQNMF